MEDKQLGISIRFIRQYDAAADKQMTASDVEVLRRYMAIRAEQIELKRIYELAEFPPRVGEL